MSASRVVLSYIPNRFSFSPRRFAKPKPMSIFIFIHHLFSSPLGTYFHIQHSGEPSNTTSTKEGAKRPWERTKYAVRHCRFSLTHSRQVQCDIVSQRAQVCDRHITLWSFRDFFSLISISLPGFFFPILAIHCLPCCQKRDGLHGQGRSGLGERRREGRGVGEATQRE